MSWTKIGFTLIFIGFALVFLSAIIPFIILILSSGFEGVNVGGGGCIVVLFIPICFGIGGTHLVTPIIIATAVLTVVVLLLSYLMFREARKGLKDVGYPYKLLVNPLTRYDPG